MDESILTFRTANASNNTICASCRHRLSHQSRRHAASAAAIAEQPEPTHQEPPIPPVTQTAPRKAYRLLASTVLSRPPLLTRELSSFEKAFYLYQKRLNERLSLPFTRYFYFKKGTPADIEWKRKQKARKTAARDIGIYSGYGDEAWNDEVLVGDRTAEPTSQVEALIRDAEGKDIMDAKPVGDAETAGQEIAGDAREGESVSQEIGQQKIACERPLPRITEADRQGDLRSLNRKLDRSLYLLVQKEDGRWRFPQDRVYGRENLHQV
jgi:large subunit ribosomal protein L46